MEINHKNTSIHYATKGSGNPLILLHGFLESLEIWKDFQDKLSEKRQVVCIDLPGHGRSGCIDAIHTMREMALTVKAVLDILNIEKAFFAGHSMGGYVNLEFQNIFPTIPTGLALINSTPKADSEERSINRDKSTRLVSKNKEAFVNMAISNLLTPENNKKFEPQVDELKHRALNFPTEGITAALQGMKIRADHSRLLESIKKPKYIIAGKNDPILDYKEIKKVSAICKTRFLSYPDGHLAFIENKNELMEFLHFID
ncbi:MAG TPA: alpha/beta hydrolase [Salegentibacter sp.]|uniref:alpha/beta fold hydrolase n=1 Tax=Salegentibacter sp. TaxID=1903072 RepID=UPI002F940D4A